MASDGRAEFDPKEIARAAFPTAFRGYDQEAVRHYLTRLAAAVGRAQQLGLLGSVDQSDDTAHIRAAEAEHEAAELRHRVEELEELLRSQPPEPEPIVPEHDERPLDEAELIEQLGHETARIVEAARSAAADIVQRASDEAATITGEAEREAATATTEAASALAAARTEADEIVAAANSDARKGQARLKADAKRSRQQAKAHAEEIIAKASAKAEDDLAAARERANQIVVDAEGLREEILGDLVRRRRANRDHLDRLTGARDRLAQALIAARTELDEVGSEIQLAVPDQAELDLSEEAAVDLASDDTEVAELVSQLQRSGADGTGFDSAGAAMANGARTTNGHANAAAGTAVGLEERVDDDDTLRLSVFESEHPSDEEANGERDELASPDGDDPADDDGARVAASDDQLVEVITLDELVDEDTPDDGLEVVDGEPAAPSEAGPIVHGPIDGDHLLEQLGFAADPVLGTESGALHRTATRGDLPRNSPFAGALPAPFEARDVALTRSTAGFRRRLKRAVNDDQSDVLDRLRAGRGPIGAAELPTLDDQLDGYVTALRPALGDMVAAGGELLGRSDEPVAALDNLCVQLAKHIVDNLRLPTIDVIEATVDHDREAILDPVRAIYRDFRNALLPDLIDDALHEAFALGLFNAVDRDGLVLWVTDPRLDPDPICEDNSASAALAKGTDFPSGHARPLSMPGCRCLAIPFG